MRSSWCLTLSMTREFQVSSMKHNGYKLTHPHEQPIILLRILKLCLYWELMIALVYGTKIREDGDHVCFSVATEMKTFKEEFLNTYSYSHAGFLLSFFTPFQ